jgi:hypothetical protein
MKRLLIALVLLSSMVSMNAYAAYACGSTLASIRGMAGPDCATDESVYDFCPFLNSRNISCTDPVHSRNIAQAYVELCKKMDAGCDKTSSIFLNACGVVGCEK